ncbi:glyoxalase [Paenibacillus rhizovicinus]|uniref:Glyoxalase n=1 Tax=Paenibacillus rhizovicinus TaxID=2704463 RepID=A0A6C0P2N7_9BACL|nr:VOC family protein [Paenibacillus rhizovicinus]QHW32758.1 glyoxalase [Paenibacillus rhizovicinus]
MSEKIQSKISHFSAIRFVADRKQALDYYAKLGFWCDYEMGFVEREGLHMIVHESDAEHVNAISPNNEIHGPHAVDLFAMVEGIEELYEEFQAKGAVLHYPLRTNDYQMKEFAIKDPEGYTIGFGESLI